MIKFYDEVEEILLEDSFEGKIERFNAFFEHYKKSEVDFCVDSEPKIFEKPSYSKFCTIVPPQKVPKRSNFTTKEGQAKLLHAIVHIEYSAIDLALDAAYRFRGLPKRFYSDWIEVAKDEVYHFLLLEKLLEELGYRYGDFEVHNSLFEASCKTNHSLLERMAVVPRYLEANGLDATPMIMEKLKKYPSNIMIDKIISALKIILKEEVSHVKKGDYWFEWICNKNKIDKDVYFKIIEKYYPNEFVKSRKLNLEARMEAGFSCEELNHLAKRKLC